MTGIHYSKDTDNIVTLKIDLSGGVNKIDQEFISEFSQAITHLENERDEIKGVIITSAKTNFIGGANLKFLLSLTKENASEFFHFISLFKSLLRRIEKLEKPVVAAINGATIGGGFEFSLACHHRIAINEASIQIGLPETTLGLIPGGGGTVRLIHLFGGEKALTYILSGKLLTPQSAKKLGLIDELALDKADLEKKAIEWINNNPHPQQPWDKSDHSIPGGDMHNPKFAMQVAAFSASALKKSCGDCPAIKELLSIATQVLTVNFEAAQRVETRGMIKLLLTQETKNIINTSFFQLGAINDGKNRPKNIPHHRVNKIGILGAGMMGCGIAVVCAKYGIDVILKDINHSAAQTGKERCDKILDHDTYKISILNRIHPTDNPHDLKDCDLIIEAVFENVDIKAKVTQEAYPFLAENGIMASNTSTLPISLLAKATKKPENFIGIHFFSPAEKMRLIEIIVGKKTSQETIAKAFDFAQQIHKIPIIVNDSRGFFTSRVFGTYVDEGARLIEEGINPAKIENAARLAGFPIGPLAVTDEVSQRLLISAAETNSQLDKEYGKANAMNGEVSLRVAKNLFVNYNRGGRAYNGGFYEYPKHGKKFLWPELKKLYYKSSSSVSLKDIQERLLFRQVIEALHCYHEGVIRTVAEANVGSILGIGFPRKTGGIFQFINAYGVENFIERAKILAERYGDRFTPPQFLASIAPLYDEKTP